LAGVMAMDVEAEALALVQQMGYAAGSSIDVTDMHGRTPLHHASQKAAVLAARTLLSAGAPMNAQDVNGMTPLHEACMRGHTELALDLMRAGAAVTVTDVEGEFSNEAGGRTPLHYAAEYGHRDVCELLLEHRADLEARSTQGATALHVAVEYGQLAIVNLLIDMKADVAACAGDKYVGESLAGGTQSQTPSWSVLHVVCAKSGHHRGSQNASDRKATQTATPRGKVVIVRSVSIPSRPPYSRPMRR